MKKIYEYICWITLIIMVLSFPVALITFFLDYWDISLYCIAAGFIAPLVGLATLFIKEYQEGNL